MNRSHRSAALTMLAAAALALLPAPAQAAPPGVEGGVYLRDLTLPAGGKTLEEGLAVLLFADEAGWADSITLSIDTSEVGVAEVTVGGEQCTTGTVVRCVVPGPHQVFQRPDDDGPHGYFTWSLVSLGLTPRDDAAAGDSGTLSVATQVEDGPTTTESATIRIGEGVNLTAVDDRSRTVAPGGAVQLRPAVRNSGTTAVDGLTAVFSADAEVLARTNYGNCTYDYAVACTFDTTLAAGATYRISAPFTLRMPPDAVAASQTSLGVQWLTAAEWEDMQAAYGDPSPGRPGTGPDLPLGKVVAAAAADLPQADLDDDDNGSYTTVTVAGGRRTDVVAMGATIPGTPGEHAIAVGLVNRGPGTLRYPPFDNNYPTAHIILPAAVSVVSADERCMSLNGVYDAPPSTAPAGFSPPEYYCRQSSTTLRPGRELTFSFTVRVARAVHEDAGSVEVALTSDGAGVDRNLRNNRAAIRLTATGGGGELPITGTIAATISAGGLALLLAGTTIVAALRRRNN
ncbi:hypothetical protein [Actinoplanes sp. RD1]|uniref:hypothetical protein n=1 Tax=Actinoplanes sp. RD1 TaxID=3064538 RepID=UPI0027418703|nr:hypothetical protein [Actinoplanes sp. RD1]